MEYRLISSGEIFSAYVDNFEYTRNRILWSEREDAHILAIPKSEKEVHTYTHKTRGPYNKNK